MCSSVCLFGPQSNFPLPKLPEGAWRVVYYHAPNRGEQLRLLFEMTETPFDDVRVSPFPSGLDRMRVASANDDSPLAFDLVPIVQHGDVTISTTVAAMQYVGETLGLIPDDKLSRAKACQLVVGSEAMRNNVFYAAYIRNQIKRAPYAHWLGHFERFLRTTADCNEEKGCFVLGAKLCYADVALYDCLTAIWSLESFENNDGTIGEAGRRNEFPLLSNLVDAVGTLPSIKQYVEIHRVKYLKNDRGEYWRQTKMAKL